MSAPEPLAALSARLDELLSDAFEAWRDAAGKPDESGLAALHDGLQKTQWRIRSAGAPAASARPSALPLFLEEGS